MSALQLDPAMILAEAARLREKIRNRTTKTDNGCWLWAGYIEPRGYGRLVAIGEQLAHRVSYRVFRGEIPEGFQVDHLCRRRSCVNPEHLEAVTARTNVLRSEGVAAKRSRQKECKLGHPFSSENTYLYPNGRRGCGTCRKMLRRKHYLGTGQ